MSTPLSKRSRRWPTAVDLFCGCGGVTAGLKAARFRVIAAIDNDPIACGTYRQNHPTVELIEDDIRRVDIGRLQNLVPSDSGLDLLVVCAPCQPFSSHRDSDARDHRASLVLQTIRFARKLRPRLILFENVPGLGGPRFKTLHDQLVDGLERLGYGVGAVSRVDAANFGVPQRRLRYLMLASKHHDSPTLPEASPATRAATVRNAFDGLSELRSGESDPIDPMHAARSHRQIVLERLDHIKEDGGSRDGLPEELELTCHKGHKGHPDVYGRMAWDEVAPTLTTGCTDITRGRFGHPRDNRAITLREAARLQTFPDSYSFVGNKSQIATQIGNAVPVQLIRGLAPMLRTLLKAP